jgi:hypothetical protein
VDARFVGDENVFELGVLQFVQAKIEFSFAFEEFGSMG